MSDYKVELLTEDIINCVPEEYKDSGRVFLDNKEEGVTIEGRISKLNNANLFLTDRLLPTFFPFSKVNNIVFQPNKEIDLRFSVDGCIFDRTVCLLNEDFKRKQYGPRKKDFKLTDIANRILLKDCDLGQFNMNETNISDNWTKAVFQDNDLGVWFPLVDYGSFAADDGLAAISTEVGDYRAWFSPLKLLRDGFCKLGWEFSSPILESTFGRRQWRYLSHTNVVKDSTISNNSFSTFSLTSNQVVTSNNSIEFDNFSLDGAGFAESTPIYQYTNFTSAPIKVCVCLEGSAIVNALGTSGVFQIRALKQKTSEPTTNEVIYETSTIGPKVIDFCQSIILDGGYTLKLQVIGNANFQTGFAGTQEVKATDRYTSGSDIQLNCAINPDLTLLDLLKAEMHLYNCILDIDLEQKQITMHIPETTQVFGETIQGYYDALHIAEDFLFDMDCDTLKITYGCGFKTADQQCFKFKDSTDEFLKAKYIEVQEEDCSGNVTTGSIEKELYDYCQYLNVQDIKKDTKENHLYEPTLNAFPSALIWTNRNTPSIPKLFDNTDGELSFDIGYRCVVGFYTEIAKNGDVAKFRLGVDLKDIIPIAFQSYRSPNLFANYNNENLTFDKDGSNLYNLFYEKETLALETKTTYSADFLIKACEVMNLSRRKNYFLIIKGKPIQVRIRAFNWQEGKASINFIRVDC